MVKFDRRSFVKTTGAAAAALPLIGTKAFGADPLKVGFVYVGPVGDHGWTYAHDQGRKMLEAELGDKVKTSFVESVKEGPDAERVIRQLADEGNKLIFTTSFGFMDPTIKVAKRYPDVMFEHATGFKQADNVSIYNARFYEGRAVLGTIAGHMSKTGTAGYIASFPIPEVVMGINAFTLAAQKVNPDFKTKVVWVNSWYDPPKEGDAAKALMDQGCDIITQHTDSPATLQAAEQRGVYAFGQASDMSKFAPKAHLTAILDVWGPTTSSAPRPCWTAPGSRKAHGQASRKAKWPCRLTTRPCRPMWSKRQRVCARPSSMARCTRSPARSRTRPVPSAMPMVRRPPTRNCSRWTGTSKACSRNLPPCLLTDESAPDPFRGTLVLTVSRPARRHRG
jgi:basic membrane protein A